MEKYLLKVNKIKIKKMRDVLSMWLQTNFNKRQTQNVYGQGIQERTK